MFVLRQPPRFYFSSEFCCAVVIRQSLTLASWFPASPKLNTKLSLICGTGIGSAPALSRIRHDLFGSVPCTPTSLFFPEFGSWSPPFALAKRFPAFSPVRLALARAVVAPRPFFRKKTGHAFCRCRFVTLIKKDWENFLVSTLLHPSRCSPRWLFWYRGDDYLWLVWCNHVFAHARVLFSRLPPETHWIIELPKQRNRSVQYNGGVLPDIILLTQGYLHQGTRLNTMKKLCICSL